MCKSLPQVKEMTVSIDNQARAIDVPIGSELDSSANSVSNQRKSIGVQELVGSSPREQVLCFVALICEALFNFLGLILLKEKQVDAAHGPTSSFLDH